MNRFAILALCLFVTACGGGGGGASATTPAVQQQTPLKPIVVAMFGDSTQAGLTEISPGNFALVPPAGAAVQDLLHTWTGRDVNVGNYGISGSTAGQLINGQDGSGITWGQRLAASNAQIVVDNHGINESWQASTVTPEVYRTELTSIVLQAQQYGKLVVLETPNPVLSGFAATATFDVAAHAAKLQVMHEVAAATGATLCDVNKAIVDAGLDNATGIPDGVHPSAALYRDVIGPTVARCLLPLLH